MKKRMVCPFTILIVVINDKAHTIPDILFSKLLSYLHDSLHTLRNVQDSVLTEQRTTLSWQLFYGVLDGIWETTCFAENKDVPKEAEWSRLCHEILVGIRQS